MLPSAFVSFPLLKDEKQMRPTSRDLAARDNAISSLMGALPGPDFGAEGRQARPSFGNFGGSFGDDPHPQANPAAAVAAWNARQATAKRAMVLRPNTGSTLDVMRFTWGIEQTLTLDTADSLDMQGNPEVDFRPQRCTANAPLPGFCTLNSMKAANVDAIVGGRVDSFNFSAQAQGSEVDFPTLTPANTMKVTGDYSGLLPDGGYVTSTDFIFIVAFTGPAGLTP